MNVRDFIDIAASEDDIEDETSQLDGLDEDDMAKKERRELASE